MAYLWRDGKISDPFPYNLTKRKVNARRTSVKRCLPALSEYIFCNLEIMRIRVFYRVLLFLFSRKVLWIMVPYLFFRHFLSSPSDGTWHSELILFSFRPGVLIIANYSINADQLTELIWYPFLAGLFSCLLLRCLENRWTIFVFTVIYFFKFPIAICCLDLVRARFLFWGLLNKYMFICVDHQA